MTSPAIDPAALRALRLAGEYCAIHGLTATAARKLALALHRALADPLGPAAAHAVAVAAAGTDPDDGLTVAETLTALARLGAALDRATLYRAVESAAERNAPFYIRKDGTWHSVADPAADLAECTLTGVEPYRLRLRQLPENVANAPAK